MSTAKRLDEPALRKPEFREGYRVELADGQEWEFPRPRLRFRPTRGEDGKIGLSGGWRHDDAYAAMRDQLVEVDAEDTFALISINMQIACYLLLDNYSLSDDDLAALLPIEFDDAANEDMWRALQPVVFANPPKRSPDGSAQA